MNAPSLKILKFFVQIDLNWGLRLMHFFPDCNNVIENSCTYVILSAKI